MRSRRSLILSSSLAISMLLSGAAMTLAAANPTTGQPGAECG